jgi:CHAT domain-containing protein
VPRLAKRPGHINEALKYAEAAHAPVLRDLLHASPRHLGEALQPELLREREQIQRERQLLDCSSAAVELERLACTNLDARDEENAWLLATKTPLITAPPLAQPAIDALARDAGPILVFYVGDARTVELLLLPSRPEPLVHIIQQPRSAVQALVEACRYALANPGQPKKPMLDAWTLPFVPLANELSSFRRLVIVPHGPLHQLPFEALLGSDGRALFDHWHVSVAPSLSALAELRQRREAPARKAYSTALFALAGGDDLRFADAEADELARILGTNRGVLHGNAAQYEAYVSNAPRARHLIIASHARRLESSKVGTFLEIAPSVAHDRRLTASEIATIPVTAELVTLAACDAARGEALLSDERLDLVRAFLVAGASAVLAARWKLRDSALTAQFLYTFYRALVERKLRKDEALDEARHWAQKSGVPESGWAAWVLVGDAR